MALSEHQLWKFKIYNKSIQYGMNSHVLRVESKTVKMADINCRCNKKGIVNKYYVGIKTFEDINKDTLEKLSKLLLKRFDEVVYYDFTINKKNLSKINLKNIQNYSSQNYWINDLESNRRDRPKTNLKFIILNHSDNLHEQIRKDIIKKCVIINRPLESSKCVIINPLYRLLNTTQIDPLIILSKHVVLTNDNIEINSNKTDESDALKRETIETKNILCQVTGFNISMQKDSSILLSHTGLKYYYKTDRKVFEQIKRTYLTKQWIESDFETQIKKIAHNIRNAKSNRNNKQERIYQYKQVNLLSVLNI